MVFIFCLLSSTYKGAEKRLKTAQNLLVLRCFLLNGKRLKGRICLVPHTLFYFMTMDEVLT